MTETTNQLRLALELDATYASAAAFDARMFDQWVEATFELFTKRTDYPKLGYLIDRLNEAGIASIVHGESFHAPLLWVEKGALEAAWGILTPIDDVNDDDPRFEAYADTRPDPDLYL